eukprot:CAMPEP_0172912030 /NCGR_PEP_ID=MMETSP1075-20121228/187686_1 /TAXON_ID=2916 /ORGANISM="Ceratium fusus, Strain PA161109" /LENGTH=53 /DNA_ID=CAMNT_0013770437 /DNA_START=144 /DNA_END=302 /DNA_ORIENTATION=-
MVNRQMPVYKVITPNDLTGTANGLLTKATVAMRVTSAAVVTSPVLVGGGIVAL